MTTTLAITGPVFTNRIIPGLPAIPGLRTLAFFGNAVDDNNSGNRVPGGPAIVVQSGAPAYAANYVPLGLQAAGARNDCLNTQNPRDAATLAGGVTWMAVTRVSQLTGSASGLVFGDTNGTALGISWAVRQLANGQLQLMPTYLAKGTITQLISPITNWHLIAMTYSGGSTGTFILYDFTENATTGVPLVWATTGITWATGVQSPHFGNVAAETAVNNPIEHAFGLVANSPLNAATLVQVAAWVRANLARRNIVC